MPMVPNSRSKRISGQLYSKKEFLQYYLPRVRYMIDKKMKKLNIGSSTPKGVHRDKPWVNIDANLGFADYRGGNLVIGSGCSLPFKNECFDEVIAIHVLEHLPRDLHLPFLTEAARVLAPSGVLFIEVPNFLQICSNIGDLTRQLVKETDPQNIAIIKELIRRATLSIYGKGRQPFDFHHWGFSPWALRELGLKLNLKGSLETEMISNHYTQEPVLLMKYTKV